LSSSVGEGPSSHRALHAKPSILSMPSSSSSSSKSRRVRLLLAPASSAVLEIRDEGKDKLLAAIDVGRVEARAVHIVHRSLVHLPHVLFVPWPGTGKENAAEVHLPPSPSVPTFRADPTFERAHSPALLGRGQASPSGARRPSSSSISFGASPPTAEKGQSKGIRDGGLHLAFDTSADAQSWLALLQSLAVPEVYHCPPRAEDARSEGVSSRPFRLKRQLKVTIGEARSLVFSTTAPLSSPSGGGEVGREACRPRPSRDPARWVAQRGRLVADLE
jgi:hypothetical protein